MLKLSFLLQGIKSDGIKNTTEIHAWRYIFWRWFFVTTPLDPLFFCDKNDFFVTWITEFNTYNVKIDLKCIFFIVFWQHKHTLVFLQTWSCQICSLSRIFLWHVTRKSIISYMFSNVHGERRFFSNASLRCARLRDMVLFKFGSATIHFIVTSQVFYCDISRIYCDMSHENRVWEMKIQICILMEHRTSEYIPMVNTLRTAKLLAIYCDIFDYFIVTSSILLWQWYVTIKSANNAQSH